jgi:hypothetical protein
MDLSLFAEIRLECSCESIVAEFLDPTRKEFLVDGLVVSKLFVLFLLSGTQLDY